MSSSRCAAAGTCTPWSSQTRRRLRSSSSPCPQVSINKKPKHRLQKQCAEKLQSCSNCKIPVCICPASNLRHPGCFYKETHLLTSSHYCTSMLLTAEENASQMNMNGFTAYFLAVITTVSWLKITRSCLWYKLVNLEWITVLLYGKCSP